MSLSPSLVGTAHVYGDNIDTDRIIPGKYTKTLDVEDLAEHVLEDLDTEFRDRVNQGDFIVGGINFGCGSSREQAPRALTAVGITAVIAKSFARIFYRNAINIGLLVIQIPNHQIQNGEKLKIDVQEQTVELLSTNNTKYQATPLPSVMVEILKMGGLVNYLKEYGGYHV